MILLLMAGQMAAQVPVLDSVCSGAVRHYGVHGDAGSTYSWIITPPMITLPSDADTVEIPWTYPAGVYELQAIQHALNGCDAEAVFGQVIIFNQPDVYAGPNDLVCVGRYYKLLNATASDTSSVLWVTGGDGTFDDSTLLHATYTPGPNDILSGVVTLTLTGYGLLADGGCEPAVSNIVLYIVTEIVPQFDSIGPLCQYSTPPALPDTSLEGITGTWAPPVISTNILGVFPYLFTPDDPSQCGVETTIYISIVSEIIPQFEQIGPLCINTVPPALPDTSLQGITGAWVPPTIDTSIPGIFTYTFTPDNPAQCGVVTTMDIVIATEIVPQFEPIGPLCQYSIPPALPDTSLEGITGTWAPPTIDTSVPGIFTYVFTADPDECGLDTIMEITILEQVIPEFDPIGPLCQYSTPPALPGTSLNGITGTWNPAWISTVNPGTFTYTFTPNDPSQCGTVVTMNITILPVIIPAFEPIGPLCQFSTPPVLPDTSLNGIGGYWTPPVISTDVTGTFTYTFTPTDPVPCVVEAIMEIIIVPEIIPTFDPIGPLCQYSIPPALPDTSLEGISGTWMPPVINTSVAGAFTYTFTPASGECAVESGMDISIITEIVPEFDTIGPLCQNSISPALPGTSLNGITGTWDPATIDTSVPGTYTFIFTPDDNSQCGLMTTMDITIVTEILPVFDPVGPLCQYSLPPALPDTSLNGVTGTWNPPVIDTSVPGTFTFIFTPGDPSQCGTETSMDIVISAELTPEFNIIGPLCQNSTPPVLPGTSLNGITGTWDPSMIDTSVTGIFTFTFTPDNPSQCGMVTTMDISIVTEIIPVFDPISPLCQYSEPVVLPGTSLNGVTGTWDPPIAGTDEPGTFTYTFTPDTGNCAIAVILIIAVTEEIIPVFDLIGPLSQNSVPPALPDTSLNGISGNWDPDTIDTSIPGTYTFTFTPDTGQCASITDMEITVLFDYLFAITGAGGHCLTGAAIVPVEVDHFLGVATFQLKLSYNVDKLLCEGWINPNPMLEAQAPITGVNDLAGGVITLNWQSSVPVSFTGQTTVCELLFTPKEPGQGQLTWYTGPTDSYFYDLNGASIAAQFFTEDMEIYEPPSIIMAEQKTVCQGDTITIYGIATSTYPPLAYQWTYPDGSIQADDPFFAGITEADAGDYILLVTDSLGCTDQKAIRLVVSENPVAEFHGADTLTVPPGYILEAGTGQASYLWNTGETNENIRIDTTGIYWVEMVSHVGCTGIDSVLVIVSEIPEECLFIPNAFTPNNDGLNDTFKAVSICPLESFQMMIYNRWGEELFETGDLTEGWDGKKNGVLCQADAYVYKIVYKPYGAPAGDRDRVKTGAVVIVK